ncbi:hypothetical protein Q5H92_08925 [Hymenobacter sp. M29]|uniref:Uncharacterized protein n=1 Tax=Hymenobacter mellowenesis TaxID=3063995 RepID=A0ABT9A9G1_9BACT|nr:hypothetical protein [Hymenobacter sp. M29]MDO7846478.1 hypothetical protein [Hymenobacter sp. M29]
MPAAPGSGSPPSINNLANTCDAAGGASLVTFTVNKGIAGVPCAVVLTNAAGDIVWTGGMTTVLNSKSFTITGTANGDYTLTADNGEATDTAGFTIACSVAPITLVARNITQPTPSVPTGRVVIEAQGGSPALTQLYINIPGVTAGTVAMSSVAVSYIYDRAGIAVGRHVATITDGSNLSNTLEVPFEILALVGGCTDPESDNYNPAATYNDGSCVIAPRLVLDTTLPALVPNGRPVWVSLSSPEIANATPAKADAFINLEFLAGTAGVVLEVNGYRLESGPVLLATNFIDAPSLVEALNAIGPLAAAYDIHQNQDDEVRLTAWAEGTRFNLDLTTSDAAKVSVVAVDGVNRFHSQRREQWGCYLEVWTGSPQSTPSTFADLYSDVYRDTYGEIVTPPGGAVRPVLAQRLELPYRADNAYRFDISAALQKFTGHAYPQPDGSCPDRLCSFFLKFGEVYATADSIRRQRNAYISGVSWTLDAVEVPAAQSLGIRLLSSRPAPWRTTGRGPTVLVPKDAQLLAIAGRVRYDGQTQEFSLPTPLDGVVLRIDYLANALGPDYLKTYVGIVDGLGGGITTPLAQVVHGPAHVLTFANGQGGCDSVPFEGEREELTKYTPSTFSTGTGTATRSATTPQAFRLNSGPLTREEYLWLRQELGNTSAVWYEKPSGPQAVNITAFSPDPDEVKAEYFLTVDCQPQEQPALGVTN